MRIPCAALLLLPLLAACSSGSGGSLPQPGSEPATSLSEAESDAQSTIRQPLATLSETHLLYVANAGNNSITVYHNSASGNTTPLYTIAGPETKITNPHQLSEDAQGNLYVANSAMDLFERSTTTAVLVFAHGANGNVAPIRDLSGSRTTLSNVQAVTVDQTTGKIFVFDWDVTDTGSSLLRFPPNANGNEAPFARSLGDFDPAIELGSDSTGQNIIEANQTPPGSSIYSGVTSMAKQFSNETSPPSPYDIFAFRSGGVADDPTTKSYVVTESNGTAGEIYRFAENTVGHGLLNDNPANYVPTPVSIITNTPCIGQLAVAPGPTPDTYCVAGNAVYVYANNARDNAKPLRILRGPATRLDSPTGIYDGL